MLQDLRFALRSLTRAKAFAIASVLTLATGIGSTTTVYAVLDALLLRPLPFGDRSDRLITIHSTHPSQATDWDDADMSYPDAIDLRERSRALAGIEGLIGRNLSLATERESERVAGASITPGLFSLLGVRPQLGRDFRDEDGAAPGLESVAIISHGVWQRLFGGTDGVVGQALPINGRAVTVIGVMPRGFAFPEQHDVWLPYRASRDAGRDRRSLTAIGLLAKGRTLADARAELGGIAAALADSHPATNRGWGVHALPLREFFVADATRRGLAAMFVAVALVLLVGCANVASLLLARGIGRARELSVRAALGAGRARLVRLMLIEVAVLSLAGGLMSLLVAAWGIDLLVRSNPEPLPYWAQVRIDARVLAFGFLLAAATALVTGLLPALRLSRADATRGQLHGERAGNTPAQRRLQGALVAGQVACSLALLVGASLLARSAMALQHADIGFDASPLMSARLYIAGDAYDDPSARAQMLERLVGRLASLPGVGAAAATGAIPGDDGGDGIRLLPDRGGVAGEDQIGAQLVPATPGLFDTLGLPLLEGRTFSSDESRDANAGVVIVNRRLAQRFWPGQGAVGRRLRVAAADATAEYRVIGVAPDLVYEELGEETDQSKLMVYVPYARAGWRTMALMVRTNGDPSALAAPLRGVVREIDPFFAPYDVLSMPDRRVMTMWGERFLGRTFAGLAIAGLLLACIGIYGLTAHSAAERRRELGIRLAIGAQRGDIIRLLLRRGAALALIGCAAGIPLAMAASQLLAGLLFRVSPWDGLVWSAAPLALVLAVLVSSFVPARRASRLDPVRALQE
jgi:putative ABC transport system permease protein